MSSTTVVTVSAISGHSLADDKSRVIELGDLASEWHAGLVDADGYGSSTNVFRTAWNTGVTIAGGAPYLSLPNSDSRLRNTAYICIVLYGRYNAQLGNMTMPSPD